MMFTNLSHLLITFACSANFYIYFAKYGGKNIFRKKTLTHLNSGHSLKNGLDAPTEERKSPDANIFPKVIIRYKPSTKSTQSQLMINSIEERQFQV